MMSSLMSVFDPSSTLLVMKTPLKMFIALVLLLIFPNWLWPVSAGVNSLVFLILNWAKSSGYGFVLCWLFQLILYINLTGMLPAAYTLSSSLQFSLGLSISLWLGGLIYAMHKNLEKVLAHLCPEGVEGPMSCFLVLIELVSLLIRPISLGVRLMANLTAGHMIMTLCESGFGLQGSLGSSFASLLSLCLISLFETAVAVVQAYIFVSLIYLYWNEY